MDKMREEFEAWISHYIGESWLKPDPVRAGEYFDNGTQSMWESWQASRAALCVELPKITDFAKDYRGAREVLNFEFAVECVARELNDVGVRHE